MVTTGISPRMMAQKTQVAGISREPTVAEGPVLNSPERAWLLAPASGPAPGGRSALRRELEPYAGADPLAEEAPALRDLVDELEAAAALVLPGGLTPVRKPAPAVVDDVHVHHRSAAHHRDRHPARVGGVLNRVRDELAGQQLGIERGRVAVQRLPDEPPGGRHFVRAAAERPGGRRRRRALHARQFQRVGDAEEGRGGGWGTRHIGLRILSYYCPYHQCNSPLTVGQLGRGLTAAKISPISLRYWLRVVFVPVAVIRSPCCVMLMLLIVTPAGSFGMVMLKSARLPRTSAGTPPASVILTLILSLPTWVTLAVASLLKPRMSTVALIWFGPSGASVMPCGMPPAWASAVNVTSADAVNWSTVALLVPWMCIPCSVAVRLAISSCPPGPAVSLLALTSTVLNVRPASWVRKGKPWMVTFGLPDRASDDLIWLAIWSSA